MSTLFCGLERIAVFSVLGIDVGTSIQQYLHHLLVASISCGLQCIVIGSTLGVDVGTLS